MERFSISRDDISTALHFLGYSPTSYEIKVKTPALPLFNGDDSDENDVDEFEVRVYSPSNQEYITFSAEHIIETFQQQLSRQSRFTLSSSDININAST